MLCINNLSTEPYFNMALEEHLLRNFSANIFMLWRNNNAIVVGKHQNTLAEINLDFVKQQNIKVVRRLSGGGTVFHDLGNLNFTFIENGEGEELINFRKYTQPILDVLAQLGVEARFEGRNDLTINGLKFSGNAEHVFRKRTLHHGTLLFSSQISDLTQALNVDPEKFKDKAVKSVRSRVTNISDHLKVKMDVKEFANRIMNHIRSKYPQATVYELSEEDRRVVEGFRDNKYATWDWNFGYSPEYNFRKSLRTPAGSIEFLLNVKDGLIRSTSIYGDFFNAADVEDICKLLSDCRHEPEEVTKRLAEVKIDAYFRGFSKEDILKALF